MRQKITKSKKPGGPTTQGFSERFNYLLDQAKFPELKNGRTTSLGEFVNVSHTSVRNWVAEDKPPKPETLELVVAKVLTRIKKKIDVRRMTIWLINGDEYADNPFEKSKPRYSHAKMYKTFMTVHEIAGQKEVDIFDLPAEAINEIHDKILKDMEDNGLDAPDPEYVAALLILAKKQL